MTDVVEVAAPLIRRLTIERFRGIENLTWHPEPGVNVILGGGDVGKTTILDAIALLLSPTHTTAISDADYWHRKVAGGFVIEAVMSLPASCGINQQRKAAWPWEWKDGKPCLPDFDSDAPVEHPVYRLRVRGTSEFELVYEVIQPNEEADSLSVALRRQIGLVRLGGDDRNDRDLRLVQGSALDRLLSDQSLKARLGRGCVRTRWRLFAQDRRADRGARIRRPSLGSAAQRPSSRSCASDCRPAR